MLTTTKLVRNTLYYNKFKYSATFKSACALSELDRRVNKIHGIPVLKGRRFIPARKTLQYINERAEDVKVRVSDKLRIYTNDIGLIAEVNSQIGELISIHEIVEVAANRIMYFANEPKHKFRMYIKGQGYNLIDAGKLKHFFKSNPDITPNRSFVRALAHEYVWIPEKFWHINYNDDSCASHFGILFPELIGKIYQLKKRPDILQE